MNLIVSSYDTLIQHCLRSWKALIVDKADQLKKFECLSKVRRDWCVFLTGTPFENCTDELWALLHFCDPNSFGSREKHPRVDELQVDGYLLQRVKEDVAKSLQSKERITDEDGPATAPFCKSLEQEQARKEFTSVAIPHQPIPSEQWQQLQQQNQILHQENQKLLLQLQEQLQEQNQMLWFLVRSQWQNTTSRTNTDGMLGGVGMQNEIMLMSTESVAGNDNKTGGGEAPESANEHRGVQKVPARSDSPGTTSMPDIAKAKDGLLRRAKRAREENVDDEVAVLEGKAAMAMLRLQSAFSET